MNKRNNNNNFASFRIPILVLIGIYYLVFGFKSAAVNIRTILTIGLLFFFMFAKSKNKTNDRPSKKVDGLINCYNCGTKVSNNEKHCPSCRVNLMGKVTCDYCGHENKLGSIICEECNGLIA